MGQDAKAVEKRRRAEALRANLRRRKAAQVARTDREGAEGEKNGPADVPGDKTG